MVWQLGLGGPASPSQLRNGSDVSVSWLSTCLHSHLLPCFLHAAMTSRLRSASSGCLSHSVRRNSAIVTTSGPEARAPLNSCRSPPDHCTAAGKCDTRQWILYVDLQYRHAAIFQLERRHERAHPNNVGNVPNAWDTSPKKVIWQTFSDTPGQHGVHSRTTLWISIWRR